MDARARRFAFFAQGNPLLFCLIASDSAFQRHSGQSFVTLFVMIHLFVSTIEVRLKFLLFSAGAYAVAKSDSRQAVVRSSLLCKSVYHAAKLTLDAVTVRNKTDHGEFIPPNAVTGEVLIECLPDDGRHRFEHRVPVFMPIGIVYTFEIIQINECKDAIFRRFF